MRHTNRYHVGMFGERLAKQLFESMGLIAKRQHDRFIGDIQVINPITDSSVNVEVKTAQLRKSKQRYDFTLEKNGHTSISGNVDYVLLLAITGLIHGNQEVIAFLIPQTDIVGLRCISIPKSLNSKYYQYANSWQTINKVLGVN